MALLHEGEGQITTFFPFLIHDFTPRELRAYPSGKPLTTEFTGVAKVVLAVKDLDLGPLGSHFKGPTGLVFTTKDPVPVAKALQNFVKANPLLTIKVGFVEGKLVQPAELKALADLPSKEALRSQLVGALQGPASQLVTLLTAPQRELVRVLEARSQSAAQ